MPSAPSWLLNSASKTSHSAPKTPTIKKEPGAETSQIAQHTTETKGTKRKKRSDSPSGSIRRKRQKKKKPRHSKEEFAALLLKLEATETWQYIRSFGSAELKVPRVSEEFEKLLERPRKRDLPLAWQHRFAVEKPTFKILKLVVDYLTGDEEQDYLCSVPGADCREKWQTVVPAIDGMQQGKLTIHKDGAFPRCIQYESRSGKTKCCNAVYRDSESAMMPPIWSLPESAPDSTPASTPSPVSPAIVAKALPGNLNPETPSHQLHHEAQAQEGNGYLASLWEQRNEAMYLSGPINASTSYAHSAGWLNQREGQVLPIGAESGATLQILDLENKGATVALPSDSHNLVCIVFEGTVEVILQDTPVFTLSRGGQWSVGVGKECRVRNPRIGTKATLYNIGAPVKQNDE